MPLIIAFVFAGCGADVSTTMTIDSNFAGSRQITLTISNDDLGDVTGGIGGLETVITGNIPKEMSYSIGDYDGGKTIVFTIDFTSISDYRAKVNAIIAAGVTAEERSEDDVPVPEVIYERNESYFKKGIRFEENFDSVDLLDWFREGLRTADIISDSESNWYENGNHYVTIEGTEYSSYSNFEVNNQENTCLNRCEVITQVMVDNSVKRTITFTVDSDTIDELAAKGCVLEDYLGALAPEGSEFTVTEEGVQNTYAFEFSADTAEDLVKKTNAILQTDTNALTLETTIDADRLGYATVAYSELLDGSFYLDYNGYNRPMASDVNVYNNTTVISSQVGESTVDYNTTEEGVRYYPSASQTYQFNMDWQIEFSDIDFSVNSLGNGNVSVTLDGKLSEDLSAEMKQSAIDRMKSFFTTDEHYEATEDSFTITYSGAIDRVVADINLLLRSVNGTIEITDDGSATPYFSIIEKAYDTPSFFTDGVAYDVTCDFTPLFGDAELRVDESDGFFGSKHYQDGIYQNDDGETCVNARSSFKVYQTSISILGVGLGVLCLALLVVGIILLLGSLRPLKEYSAYKKQMKAAAAASAPIAQPAPAPTYEPEYEPEYAAPAPVAEPVYAAPAPVTEPMYAAPAPAAEPMYAAPAPAPAPAVENDNDEEEIL